VGYYATKMADAGNHAEAEDAACKMFAAGVDTQIAVVEPWGGIILASWTVSTLATEAILEKLGYDVSPLTRRVCASPGSALAFLVTDWFTDNIPEEFIKSASDLAMKKVEDQVDEWNKRKDGTMYMLVKPTDAK